MLDVRFSVSVRTSLRVHTGALVSPNCNTVSTFEGISEDYHPKGEHLRYIPTREEEELYFSSRNKAATKV